MCQRWQVLLAFMVSRLLLHQQTILSIECVDFNDVRQRFYQVPTLQDLFKTVKPEVILDFLKAAALYRLL